ncbi:MAG: hypothetical protein ACREM1_09390 [Longimicrobiales bacterium]
MLPRRVATYEFEDTTLVNWRRDWDYELPSFFGGSGFDVSIAYGGIWSTLDDVAIGELIQSHQWHQVGLVPQPRCPYC